VPGEPVVGSVACQWDWGWCVPRTPTAHADYVGGIWKNKKRVSHGRTSAQSDPNVRAYDLGRFAGAQPKRLAQLSGMTDEVTI
jgi:hypothetical protein